VPSTSSESGMPQLWQNLISFSISSYFYSISRTTIRKITFTSSPFCHLTLQRYYKVAIPANICDILHRKCDEWYYWLAPKALLFLTKVFCYDLLNFLPLFACLLKINVYLCKVFINKDAITFM